MKRGYQATSIYDQPVRQSRLALVLVGLAGALEALLLARLIARLLAARPDNPALTMLYTLTWPFVAPFAFLNYDQPPFGAVFERSTLLVVVGLPIIAYLAWAWLRPDA